MPVSIQPKELDDVCGTVANRPKPAVEEAADVGDQNSGAHNGPTGSQEAEEKGNQHPKPGAKQMEVDWGPDCDNHLQVFHYVPPRK